MLVGVSDAGRAPRTVLVIAGPTGHLTWEYRHNKHTINVQNHIKLRVRWDLPHTSIVLGILFQIIKVIFCTKVKNFDMKL